MPRHKHDNGVETKRKLTLHLVQTISPPTQGQRLEIYDSATPGLILRVTRTGAKSFAFWYRNRATKAKLVMTLGRYPKISFDMARSLAKQAHADVLYGKDPLSKSPYYWKNAEAAERTLFRSVWQQYWTEHLCKKGLRSRDEVKRMVERDVLDKWSKLPVGQITASNWKAVAGKIEARGSPQAATNLFRALRTFFRWCAKEQLIVASPLANQSVPNSQPIRERYLTERELVLFWKATAEPALFHSFLRLLLLTGARRQELAAARWSEFDLDGGYWIVPSSRSKNKREIKRPLSDLAVKLLKRMRAGRTSDFVFPAKRSGKHPHITGFAELKNDFDAVSGLAEWRLHDLRRTITTHLAEHGVLPHITEAILAHRKKGLEAVYNLAQYRSEIRRALNLWASHLEYLGDDTSDLFAHAQQAQNIVA